MSAPDSRRLRRAVAELAACGDEDIAWIMDTLSPPQRERLTALIESGAPLSANAMDFADISLANIIEEAPAFLVPRFRRALAADEGEGRLTPATRDVVADALRSHAARQPARAPEPARPRGVRAWLPRWLRIPA